MNYKSDGETQVIFLNFEGAEIINDGFDDPENNKSWIPDYASVTIPPFNHEPHLKAPLSDRQSVIDALTGMVRHYFAPFNVLVTNVRPEPGTDYTMMMVGGSASLITAYPGGMVGVSPLDCRNSSSRDVAFTFSDDLPSLDDIATTITHESGHNLGLNHVDNTSAIMNPYVTTDPYWQAGTVPDGTSCDGSSTQDSFDMLGENLGFEPDKEKPWVDFLYPGNGARVPIQFTVNLTTGDKRGIGRYVELFVDNESKGLRTYPYLSWKLSSMTPGRHTLKATAADENDNSTTFSITVTVDPDCSETSTCTDGKAGVGDICSNENSCNLSLCVEGSAGSFCSSECLPLTSSCAPGMVCLPSGEQENKFYCAKGSGEVFIVSTARDHLLGCTSSGNNRPTSYPLYLFVFLGTVAVIRRKFRK